MHAARHPFPNTSLSPTPDVPPQVPTAIAPATSVLADPINPIPATCSFINTESRRATSAGEKAKGALFPRYRARRVGGSCSDYRRQCV